jgi:hypothetical protein
MYVGGRGEETLRTRRTVCRTGQAFRASRDWQTGRTQKCRIVCRTGQVFRVSRDWQTGRTQTCRLQRQKRHGGLAGWTSRKDLFDKSMVGWRAEAGRDGLWLSGLPNL